MCERSAGITAILCEPVQGVIRWMRAIEEYGKGTYIITRVPAAITSLQLIIARILDEKSTAFTSRSTWIKRRRI